MSEILTIRLNSDALAPIPWLVWSAAQQEVIASGTLSGEAALPELGDYLSGRDLNVLVAGNALTLTEVVIPKGSDRQLQTVLPYLLEEELAQDVDLLHVALLGRDGEKGHVAVIEHRLMARWLDTLAELGVQPKKMLPDVLALPLVDESLTAAELNGEWLVRDGKFGGTVADAAMLPVWLDARDAWMAPDLKVTSYSPVPANIPGEWDAAEPEMVMALLAEGAAQSRVSLLSGPYRQQSAVIKSLKVWRLPVAVALVLLAVMGVENWKKVSEMEAQAAALRQQSEQVFRQVLPQFRKIPTTSYLKNQMNNELKRLGGVSSDDGVLVWLSQLQPILAQVPGMTMESLRFERERQELKFEASGKDFSEFETLRGKLSEHFNTELGQLNRSEEKITGIFLLKRAS